MVKSACPPVFLIHVNHVTEDDQKESVVEFNTYGPYLTAQEALNERDALVQFKFNGSSSQVDVYSTSKPSKKFADQITQIVPAYADATITEFPPEYVTSAKRRHNCETRKRKKSQQEDEGVVVDRQKRTPTEYNNFIKNEMIAQKILNPDLDHKVLFQKVAASWKLSAQNPKYEENVFLATQTQKFVDTGVSLDEATRQATELWRVDHPLPNKKKAVAPTKQSPELTTYVPVVEEEKEEKKRGRKKKVVAPVDDETTNGNIDDVSESDIARKSTEKVETQPKKRSRKN